MAKQIVPAIVLCLILVSIFTMASNVLSVKGCFPPGYVPPGENVEVFPNPMVGLVFDEVTVEGWATATETTRYPPPPPPSPPDEESMAATNALPPPIFVAVWDIKVTATFSGNVVVSIDYGASETSPTQLLQTDIIPGDVNADGKVNFLDLCIIVRALGSCPNSRRWNPYCDLNGDGKINLKDLCIALQHLGQKSVWTEITWYIDTDNHIAYGITDHFSIFGIR